MTTKVFCKNCKHKYRVIYEAGERCIAVAEIKYHPVHGEQYIHPKCCDKNANFNCPDYKEPGVFDGVSGIMLSMVGFLIVVFFIGFVLYKLTMVG